MNSLHECPASDEVVVVGPRLAGGIEDLLRGLLLRDMACLRLSFNDHTANYVDAAKEYADGEMPDDEWVSESERDKALGLNQVWTLQWYPDTPVGFHIMRASSLAALLGWVIEHGPST